MAGRIGKMKQVPGNAAIKGCPKEIYTGKRGDSFYDSARYGSAPVKTTGGIPGGKSSESAFSNRKESGSTEFRGSANKKGSGHSFITNGPLNHGG